MRQARFDALIAPTFRQKDDLRGTEIGAWPWKVYGRKDHPAFAKWSLKAWERYPHLQVSSTSPTAQGPIDRAADKLGASRHIGAVVTHFSMAAPILAQTDMLLSVPSVAMQETAAIYGLQQQELPFRIPPLELSLFRSAITGDEPEIRWFHGHLASAFEALEDSE
jgi:DNA-binding transcriptional LysR family regulator